MKLSTRARYGLRLCFLIAISKDESVSLPTLVKQTSLSEKYLEQILGKLRKSGIISARRGLHGGYFLTEKPEDISVNNILLALDDGFEFSDCVQGKCSDLYCPNKKMFKKLYEGITSYLDSTTLKDMINDYSCTCGENKNE